MRQLYHTLFYQPLLNALVFLYHTAAFGDLGLAIIELTILIRIILYPIFQKSARHQAVMQRLQPKLKEIQAKHKDYTARNQASLDLFKEHKINPFSGILLLLLQLPILFALYHIFLNLFSPDFFASLYSFVAAPGILDSRTLFGLLDLNQSSHTAFFALLNSFEGVKNLVGNAIPVLLVALAVVAQFFQGKLMVPAPSGSQPSAAEIASRRMIWIGPALTALVLWNLPSAAALYWLVSSVFSLVQQIYINRQLRNEQLGTVS